MKAYYFLEALELDGGGADSIETANDLSLGLFESWSDSDLDNRAIKRAIAYAKQNHNGNQMPVINEARAKGFLG